MKLILIATTILHLAWSASIADVTCPDSCTCQLKDEHLETSCASYEFIKKLLPKQESTIVRLNINNASLVNVDLKLKYLKNLHSLDLSSNKITNLPSQFPYLPKLRSLNLSNNYLSEVAFSQLPKNLNVLDLSYNSITTFPKDWSNLKQLKVLHFHDNPIDCDCDSLLIYEQLLKEDIIIPENLTCYSSKTINRELLLSINCSQIKENLLNAMLGDESGSGLEEFEPIVEDGLEDEYEQYINAEGVTNKEEEEFDEGSGDEGSGLIPILPIPDQPKACHFNCSTPRPIGINDEKDASPPPGVREQAKIIFEDILQPEMVTVHTTTPAEEEEEIKTQHVPILKEAPEIYNETGDKDLGSEVETFPTNDTVLTEMERASFKNNNSQSVYIVVGLLIAFVALLIVYYINKKKNQKKKANRKRNKSNENGLGEEMKPLGKSAEVTKEPVNSKPNETAPLLNGQNGKVTEDKKEEDDELENVELRKPDKQQESLTPQPERVTIKAGELPDSIPKTPMLVHRQLNSDGEIVTTTINSN